MWFAFKESVRSPVLLNFLPTARLGPAAVTYAVCLPSKMWGFMNRPFDGPQRLAKRTNGADDYDEVRATPSLGGDGGSAITKHEHRG